jgi:hypothetical protein
MSNGYTGQSMKNILHRFYYAILAVLGLVGLVGAFVLGLEEGRSLQERVPINLSCSQDVLEQLRIPVQTLANSPVSGTKPAGKAATGKFVGSKNGTKYYTPTCSGAKRIKPENYIWFKTEDDAKLQGYTPGKC